VHAELHRLDLLQTFPFSGEVFGAQNLCIQVIVVNKAVYELVSTAPEHVHVLSKDQLFNRDIIFVSQDIIAHGELLQIDQALRLEELVAGGIVEVNIRVEGAVFEHLFGGCFFGRNHNRRSAHKLI